MVRTILAACLALCLTSPASADALDDILERGIVKLGVRGSAPPFAYLDERGQPAGLAVLTSRGTLHRVDAEGVEHENQLFGGHVRHRPLDHFVATDAADSTVEDRHAVGKSLVNRTPLRHLLETLCSIA